MSEKIKIKISVGGEKKSQIGCMSEEKKKERNRVIKTLCFHDLLYTMLNTTQFLLVAVPICLCISDEDGKSIL